MFEQGGAHVQPDQRNTALSDLRARRLWVGEAVRETGEVGFEAFISEIMKVRQRGEQLPSVPKEESPRRGSGAPNGRCNMNAKADRLPAQGRACSTPTTEFRRCNKDRGAAGATGQAPELHRRRVLAQA